MPSPVGRITSAERREMARFRQGVRDTLAISAFLLFCIVGFCVLAIAWGGGEARCGAFGSTPCHHRHSRGPHQ